MGNQGIHFFPISSAMLFFEQHSFAWQEKTLNGICVWCVFVEWCCVAFCVCFVCRRISCGYCDNRGVRYWVLLLVIRFELVKFWCSGFPSHFFSVVVSFALFRCRLRWFLLFVKLIYRNPVCGISFSLLGFSCWLFEVWARCQLLVLVFRCDIMFLGTIGGIWLVDCYLDLYSFWSYGKMSDASVRMLSVLFC